MHDDTKIVQWELRRSKTERPRWRCGTLTAKTILDDTDPGYRYWLPENVQTTSVRRSNANMCAYAEICALPVTKLSIVDMDKLYPWLLEGSERDVREIHGGTGVSPKLLHIYAQITQLSARSMEVRFQVLVKIRNMLADFTDLLCNRTLGRRS